MVNSIAFMSSHISNIRINFWQPIMFQFTHKLSYWCTSEQSWFDSRPEKFYCRKPPEWNSLNLTVITEKLDIILNISDTVTKTNLIIIIIIWGRIRAIRQRDIIRPIQKPDLNFPFTFTLSSFLQRQRKKYIQKRNGYKLFL